MTPGTFAALLGVLVLLGGIDWVRRMRAAHAGPGRRRRRQFIVRVRRRAARATGLLVFSASAAALALAAWESIVLRRSPAPGGIPEPGATAGLTLAGAALWLYGAGRSVRTRVLCQACAATLVAGGILGLVEYFANSGAGRIPPAVAANFLLLGCALLLVIQRRAIAIAQFLIVLGVSFLALGATDTLYGVGSAFGVPWYEAFSSLVLSAGFLLAHINKGPLASLASPAPGGVMARRLLPAAVLFPIWLGGLIWLGRRKALYGEAFGFALLAWAVILSFAFLLWANSCLLNLLDRKRLLSERELRRSERQFRALLESAPDAMVITDERGRIVLVNAQAEKLFGYTRDELLGQLVETLAPQRSRAVHERHRASYAECPHVEHLRHHGSIAGVRKDGTEFAAEVSLSPIRTAQGTWVASSIRDITEREKTARQLRESESRYRTLTESLPQMIWTSRPDGRCDYLSPRWLAYTGAAEQDHLGSGWLEALHPEDRERIRELWEAAVGRGEGFDPYCRIRNAPGEYRWFHALAVAQRDHAGAATAWFGSWTDVHEVKLAQDVLRKNEAMFRELADAMPQIVWTAQPDGRVTHYNQRWYDYTGMSVDQAEEWACHFALHPADLPRCRESWTRSVTTGEAYDVECRLKHARSGLYRWHLGRATAVLDDNAKVVRWFGTYTDIDDQKQAEASARRLNETLEMRVQERSAELSESEERYRRLIEGIRDYAIVMLDPEGRVVSWSPSAERIKGYSAAEILGRHFSCFYPAEEIEGGHPCDVLRRAVEDGHFEEEGWRVRRDGSRFWANVMITPMRDESGNLRGFSKVTRDVTERKEGQEKLQHSEEQFKALLELAPDAVLIVDQEGKIVLVSAQAEGLFGYGRHELIGERVEILMPQAHRANHEHHRRDFGAAPRVRKMGSGMELKGLHKSGREFPIEISLSPIQTAQGSWVAAAIRDITERKQVEQQLIEERRRAEAANRAKTGFLAAMSHEIRTPMNSILGMADLLSESPLDADQRHYVEVFRRAGSNLVTLIDDILDLSKIEAGHFELERIPFDLEEILDQALELIGSKARARGLALRRLSPGLTGPVLGDPTRLRQVLINLLGNAVKFTEAGGITLVVQRHSPERPDEIEFLVSDTGIGIAAEKIEMIFGDFTQADSSTTRKYGGTGLGLAISRRLVERMGGQLGVTSVLGRGSTFRFTIVLEPAPTGGAGVDGAQTAPAGNQREIEQRPLKILLADDSADNRLLIQVYLNNSPHTLALVEDGRRAVERFGAGAFDVVLMDIQMPVMDGLDATRAIRKIEQLRGLAPVPIIALTANARAEDVELSKRAGCDAHLSKPISKQRLIAVLEQFGAAGTSPGVQIPQGLEKLIPGYLLSRQQDLEDLRRLAAAGEFRRIRTLAHNMKGTGASYGFPGLSEIGEGILSSAEAKDQAMLSLRIGELADYLNRLTPMTRE